MAPAIHEHLQTIRELCSRYKVRRLEVFGSVVRNQSNHHSDVDLLVEFLPLKEGEYAEAYFSLKEQLEAVFGCNVDLVMVGAITNQCFLKAIEPERELLYAA